MRSARRLLLVAASGLALSAGLVSIANAQSQAAPVAASTAQVAPSNPWAQATSDIPADPAVRYGLLPNGMRYALLHNATPPGQASFRLRIDAGSLMERDDQKGLAHFMEHMAFNGTKDVPENEMMRILERLGLAFGADTNAFTSFDQTAYMLELPNTKDETVDPSLHILREMMSAALMAPDAIDSERGVIVGEERTRDTPQFRVLKTQLGLLAPGQRLSQRLPIGDLDIIRTAPRQQFVDFYDAYYRPSRATFIAVGDFDVDAMEAKVRAAFADWTPKAPDGPEPDLGTVAARQPQTSIIVEPGIQSSIQINWIKAPDLNPDTVAEREADIRRGLGMAVLNRRLGEIARADNPPFIGAGAGYQSLFDSLDAGVLSVAFNPGGWKRALETVEQESRRLAQYGVTEAELQREIVNTRTTLQNAVASAATRSTSVLASALLSAVNEDQVFSAPQTNLDLFNKAVDGLTVAQVDQAARTVFEGQGPLVLFSSPVPVEGGEAAVTAALEASRNTPVQARAAEAELKWPYDSFGAPAQPAARSEVADLGATLVRFPNGTLLNIKKTDFRADQVLVSARTGLGELGLPADRLTPVAMASTILTAGGLGKLSLDEMNRVLSGRTYSASVNQATDAYVFSGATKPADLQLELQVLAAYLTDPGLRAAPFEQTKAVFPQILAQLGATPRGVFQRDASGLLASGDVRETTPTADQVAAIQIDDVRNGVRSDLAQGPVRDHGRRRRGHRGGHRRRRRHLRRPACARRGAHAARRLGGTQIPRADGCAGPVAPHRPGRTGAGLRRLADHRPGSRPQDRPPAVDPVGRAATAPERRNPRETGSGLFAQRRLHLVQRLPGLRLYRRDRRDAACGPAQIVRDGGRHRRRSARPSRQRGRVEPRPSPGGRTHPPQHGRQRLLADATIQGPVRSGGPGPDAQPALDTGSRHRR